MFFFQLAKVVKIFQTTAKTAAGFTGFNAIFQESAAAPPYPVGKCHLYFAKKPVGKRALPADFTQKIFLRPVGSKRQSRAAPP